MQIALLNRDKLRKLADSKLEEARILLDNGQWNGAYYMSGLSVECALKSVLASAVKEHDFPNNKFVNKMYQHDLQDLCELDAQLWLDLQADMKLDQKLRANWSTVKDWDDERRYDTGVEELEAKEIYAAITEAVSGVISWIKGRW